MDKLISQQAAINVVSEITTTMSVCANKDECYGMKRMQKQAITELENLPSIQPEQRRIPCSERLPEPWDLVLVTDRSKDVRLCQMHHNSSDGWYDECDNWMYFSTSVIAWMPLPDPYQERGE